ncbi:ubiquitin-conjugating enzyme E2 Z [Rhipicephalus microplus]|uniref:ubiquitin-conjugating enzyme E2 Z n=1 Tax=Rhipicephalus microplus TaxID=6941 RepID=UPI003F6CE074
MMLFPHIAPADRESQDKPKQISAPSPNFWDPISCEHEEPTPGCLFRVEQDIKEVERYRVPGIFISAEEHNVTKIHALILGPPGTPYEGGFFHFLIKCPADYPHSPPRVRLMTTDAGRVRFGPSFYENGKVCLGLLGTSSYGTTWSSSQCLGNVLYTIKSLMTNENPVTLGSGFGVLPTLGTWLNDKIRYNTTLQHETIRVAVCNAVEGCLRGRSACPRSLRDEILRYFPQFFGEYMTVVRNHLHLTGSYMNDSAEGGVPTYQFETLMAHLVALREDVELVNPMPYEKEQG